MTAQLPYQLFVSYSQNNRGWVEGYLLDALRTAGVRVLSQLNFVAGAPRIEEFERAVTQCERTLLVLSPAYIAEAGMSFLDVMVQHYGLESGVWPVIPLILEPVALPPRLAFLVALDATDVERWPEAVVRLCQAVQAGPPLPASRPPCPYPGMRAFRREEATQFYGRESEVADLLQRLRLHPFVAIIGASGSGKSSLVSAGLLPALQRSTLFGAGGWLVRTFRPGAEPLAAMQTALGGVELELFTPAPLLATEQAAARVLLIIDQFEELFTQGADQVEAFCAAIQRFVALRDCYLVMTVRADFFGDLLSSALWPLLQAHRLEIAPLSADGLRAAIVKPAEDKGVFIESALVERLVAGSVGQPGLLPFVQEVLVRLWDKLERRYLPLSAYEALVLPLAGYSGKGRSGIQAAMAQLADEMIDRLPEDQQRIARRIFLRLVQFGEGRDNTRRQQPVSALRAAGDDPARFDATLNYLVENRLLVLSGDAAGEPRVDLAHEAMLTGWPRLEGWADEGRAAEATRRRYEERAAEWRQMGRGKSGLFDGRQLRQVEAWLRASDQLGLGCSVDLKALIAKSSVAVRRRRATIAVLASVPLILFTCAVTNAVRSWWINRPWEPVAELRQVNVYALATSPGELAAGSTGYGVSLFRGDAWTPWQATAIPTGAPGKVVEAADANVDAVLALAYDPLRPHDLYAWIEGEGVFQLDRTSMAWNLLGAPGPVITSAGAPLAASDGAVLAIGDDLGFWLWDANRRQWQHITDTSPLLNQEFEAVVVDGRGVPVLVGQGGVVRGTGAPPWQWESLSNLVGAKALAVGDDGSIYVATVNEHGAQLVCLDPAGQELQPAIPIPVANWVMQFVGVLIGPFNGEAQAKMLMAHPTVQGRFFVTTNQGALFDMTCAGEAEFVGQQSFWQTARSQLAYWLAKDRDATLVWGNFAGLFQRTLPQ